MTTAMGPTIPVKKMTSNPKLQQCLIDNGAMVAVKLLCIL